MWRAPRSGASISPYTAGRTGTSLDLPHAVVRDVFRRLVSWTLSLAQQTSDAFMDACSPFQYALSTRAGAEVLARGRGVGRSEWPLH